MYSPPPPRRRPTCWDPPAYWETPGQLPFHEDSGYDQPLPPGPNSRWDQPYTAQDTEAPPHTFHSGYSASQPASRQPRSATTAANPIDAMLDRLLEACNKMESRLDATDRRVDSLLPPELPEPAPPYDSKDFGSRDLVQPGPAPAFELPISAAPRPYQPVTAPLLASKPNPQGAVPSSMKKEWETNMHESEEGTEIQVLVDEHKAALETTKQDLEVGMEERRRLFEDELRLKPEELVKKGGAYLCALVGDEVAYALPKGLKEIAFFYVDLHVGDVASMNHRSTSLDADARLIPPRSDTPCLSICGCVDKIPILVLNYHDPKGPPLVIFEGDDEGRHSTIRCAFDPGGETSRLLLSSTLFVASWFPP